MSYKTKNRSAHSKRKTKKPKRDASRSKKKPKKPKSKSESKHSKRKSKKPKRDALRSKKQPKISKSKSETKHSKRKAKKPKPEGLRSKKQPKVPNIKAASVNSKRETKEPTPDGSLSKKQPIIPNIKDVELKISNLRVNLKIAADKCREDMRSDRAGLQTTYGGAMARLNLWKKHQNPKEENKRKIGDRNMDHARNVLSSLSKLRSTARKMEVDSVCSESPRTLRLTAAKSWPSSRTLSPSSSLSDASSLPKRHRESKRENQTPKGHSDLWSKERTSPKYSTQTRCKPAKPSFRNVGSGNYSSTGYTPVNNNETHSYSNCTPVNEATRGFSTYTSVNEANREFSTYTPVNEATRGYSTYTPVNQATRGYSTYTPVSQATRGFSTFTPVNEANRGYSTYNPANETTWGYTPVNTTADYSTYTPNIEARVSRPLAHSNNAGRIVYSQQPTESQYVTVRTSPGVSRASYTPGYKHHNQKSTQELLSRMRSWPVLDSDDFLEYGS